jgi:D-beta-D-heptose 7-phosphate kinase/D-beta-D-heptose 1-phosphate adenosyltransferase
MDKAKLLSTIDRFGESRVLVIGDLMLDRFIWGKVSRISPEAPVPVVLIERESIMLGGAANVGNNLAALGGKCTLLGTLGDDEAAQEFRGELLSRGIEGGGIVVDRDRPTIQKTRVVAHSQQVVRVDKEEKGDLSDAAIGELLEIMDASADSADAIIISDYAKGVVTERLMDAASRKAIDRGIPLVVDPKRSDVSFYQGATYITPNMKEAAEISGVEMVDACSIELAGKLIMGAGSFGGVLITQGEDGMTLIREKGEPYHVPSVAIKVYDVTGAGDTVISAFALALSGGLEDVEAVFLANLAAGLVVQKVGTAVVTPDELKARVKDA